MGNSSSTIQRSKPGDTVSNLTWAIKESARWQQVCQDLDVIITDEADYADWRQCVIDKGDTADQPLPPVSEGEEEKHGGSHHEGQEDQGHHLTVNKWRRKSISMPGLRRPEAPPTPELRGAAEIVSVSLPPHQSEEEDLRQIQAKKDCVAYLLNELTTSGEATYRLQCRQKVLRDWIKQLKGKKPVRKAHLEEEIEQLEEQLAESLWVWDNARAACLWLQDVVMLNVRQKKTKDALHTGAPQTHRFSGRASPQLKQQLEAREDSKSLRDTARKLFDDSLEIGFNWLDTNRSKYLEPSDVPEFSAQQFALLDAKGKYKVSCAELRKRLHYLNDEADKVDNKYQQLLRDGQELDKRITTLERMTAPAREQPSLRRQRDQLVVRLHQLNNRLSKLDQERQEKHGMVESIESMLLSSISSNILAIIKGQTLLRTYMNPTFNGELDLHQAAAQPRQAHAAIEPVTDQREQLPRSVDQLSSGALDQRSQQPEVTKPSAVAGFSSGERPQFMYYEGGHDERDFGQDRLAEQPYESTPAQDAPSALPLGSQRRSFDQGEPAWSSVAPVGAGLAGLGEGVSPGVMGREGLVNTAPGVSVQQLQQSPQHVFGGGEDEEELRDGLVEEVITPAAAYQQFAPSAGDGFGGYGGFQSPHVQTSQVLGNDPILQPPRGGFSEPKQEQTLDTTPALLPPPGGFPGIDKQQQPTSAVPGWVDEEHSFGHSPELDASLDQAQAHPVEAPLKEQPKGLEELEQLQTTQPKTSQPFQPSFSQQAPLVAESEFPEDVDTLPQRPEKQEPQAEILLQHQQQPSAEPEQEDQENQAPVFRKYPYFKELRKPPKVSRQEPAKGDNIGNQPAEPLPSSDQRQGIFGSTAAGREIPIAGPSSEASELPSMRPQVMMAAHTGASPQEQPASSLPTEQAKSPLTAAASPTLRQWPTAPTTRAEGSTQPRPQERESTVASPRTSVPLAGV